MKITDEILKDYATNPSKCLKCEKILSYLKRKNKFCSQSCSASYNNTGVRRHGKEKSKCIHCESFNTRANRTFCSNQCQQDYKWKQLCESVEKTGVLPSSNPLSKKYLKQKYGIRCQICGIEEWLGKEVPLVLDHIDGNPYNYNIENLRIICGNCDMQTPTYKGKNKGNGRYERKKRYREGKSY